MPSPQGATAPIPAARETDQPEPMSSPRITTAALLTPLSPGAIAVIALQGPAAEKTLAALLGLTSKPAIPPNVPSLRTLADSLGTIDDAIITRIVSPCAERFEICTHGGVRIAQRTLLALQQNGARIIPADEFAKLHFESNPIRHDADRALLHANSRRLAHWLLAQRRLLPDFLADAPTLPENERSAFNLRTHAAIALLSGLELALIGPPNAGKSTLANRLIGHDRIITSDLPGTTRDWISETALIDGWPVTLTDTAGIRDTECLIEQEAIIRGTRQAHRADLILIILDANAPDLTAPSILESLRKSLPPDRPNFCLLNKSDRLPDAPHDSASSIQLALTSELNPLEILYISALTGHGIPELERAISRSLNLHLLNNTLATGFAPSHLLA